MASKLRILVLGAPGSGKGTISSRIVKEFKLKHLSSGNILRDNINRKTPIGEKVKELVASGEFVSDELITKILLNELQELKNVSWLLDGFPRTLNQANALNKENLGLDKVLNLNVPFQVIVDRLKHRWVHPASGRVYNLEFNPPIIPFKDDFTGETLIQRDDDKPETVLARLKTYESQTKPLIDYYTKQNLVETYTGNTSDFIWPMVKYDLRKILKNKNELVTHTGQKFLDDDSRKARFLDMSGKQINKNFAIDLVAQDPIVVTDLRTVVSCGGGSLGHPKVYINVDKNMVHVCDYSGRRFIKKKYYNEAIHGNSITYDAYLEQVAKLEALEHGV